LLQPSSKIAINRTLIPLDHQRERRPISPAELFDQRLIRNIRQSWFPTTFTNKRAKILPYPKDATPQTGQQSTRLVLI
jgi:hypothetical protein